ncbi:MAG: hypothetical protein V4606_02020 [Patescibacteria group bacterium]
MTVFAVSVPTHKAEAGGAGGGATLGMQIVQQAELASSALSNAATAVGVNSLVLKETVLDGIGWAIAKQMVSSMTRSLINWINSGFEGSPAFITDLNAFLLDALDTAAGEYIRSLGGIGEFICSPFRLDVQAALSVSYAQARSGMPSGPTAPACRLSDIANNIEGFFAGVSDGGWGEWLDVTSSPQNTPYGAYLEAQARLNIKLKNEAGQEIEVASWGDGFLSKKICETIEGSGGRENCTISTPGQVISEALTFQLSTGPRSLIEADEINELIGALLNQLVTAAMEGINGLLGLSEGTGYTDYSLNGSSTRAYLDDMVDQGSLNTSATLSQMQTSLTTEQSYLTLTSGTLSEASRRLSLVAASQSAITNLFAAGNPGTNLANITRSDTLTSARSKVSTALSDSPTTQERADLTVVQTQLDTISNALSVIATMSDDRTLATTLPTFTFTRLEAEGARVVTQLTTLVSELNVIVPRTTANVSRLTSLISRYNNADVPVIGSSASTSSPTSIRNDVALEYSTLVTGGTLTTQLTIDQNRTRWRQALNL